MSFGKNLKYLRYISGNITQEDLAEKLNVSRQTVSKWDECTPEVGKAIGLCEVFNCSLDSLFRQEMCTLDDSYTDFRVEMIPGFRYVKYAVISCDPEGDAIDRVRKIAWDNGVEDPKLIGWIFPHVSQEQNTIYHMHGYEAAWVLPDGLTPLGVEVTEQKTHLYAAIHIPKPFQTPFVSIPGAYRSLMAYMRINGLKSVQKDVIPNFATIGDAMDVYIACD